MSSPEGEPAPSAGRMRPTSPGALAAWAAVGLVGGRLLRPVGERVLGTAPIVSWLQPGALVLAAVLLGVTAWLTWRTVHVRRERLDPRLAVNRLLLARACALVGALAAGGYAGYALAWLGIDTALGEQRLWRSVLAAVSAAVLVATAVLLERACRVRSDDPEP